MDKFIKYFKTPFIVTAIIVLVCTVIKISASDPKEWNNAEAILDSNVYDMADNLTDEQEADLDAYISTVEKLIESDIVVITLNETLEGYYDESDASRWVKWYAEEVAINNKMGYNKPSTYGDVGDCVVFVDNIYREPSTGRVYSWIAAGGNTGVELDTYDCEAIMDEALADLTDYSTSEDYYSAYYSVVQLLPGKMGSPSGFAISYMKPMYILMAALVIAIIYIFANWKSKAGKKTTVSTTYVTNGHPNMLEKRDVFLRKTVSKTRRESSSSSGGGGSSGGFSGGGHSR